MNTADVYTAKLRALGDWEPFLIAKSRLPGPRSNLELLAVVAQQGRQAEFLKWCSITADEAPVNTPKEFLVACGTVGLGRLVSQGDTKHLSKLRTLASDPRWRVREAVAMGLQLWGDTDLKSLLAEMTKWSSGNWTEQRAAAAALCEPRLLTDEADVRRVLELLDKITTNVHQAKARKAEGWDALRKGLGYCWSVAVAAEVSQGKRSMEKWLRSQDPDIRWIMKENLKKKRLIRMDPAWVAQWQKSLETST